MDKEVWRVNLTFTFAYVNDLYFPCMFEMCVSENES